MNVDFSHMQSQIRSERPPSVDLLGTSTRLWPVVYMTPPWMFRHRSEKGDSRGPSGGRTATYDFSDLASMPIPSLLERNAAVFVWAPDTQLPKVFSLFDVWGLRYNGIAFHWTRTREGADPECLHHERDVPMYTGYITRGNPVMLVMGVKGEPALRKHRHDDGTRRPLKNIRKQQFAPRPPEGAHPRFRDLVAKLYDGPYLELFGDGAQGWDSWIPSVEG